tara:strand:- start:55197 stop:55802 length:606 start_codon:yes stop_codon:yes gene_type:complete
MSFILDALRKSENERLKSEPPKITSIPYALPIKKLPIWIKSTILLLSLLCVGLAWLWLKDEVNRSQLDLIESPMPVLSNTELYNQNLSTSETIEQKIEDLTDRNISELANENNFQSEIMIDTDEEIIPTYMELKAQGLSLPDLNIELHVFSNVDDNSFVRINSRSFREGDYISPEGISIVEINESGVVAQFQGYIFLLTLN